MLKCDRGPSQLKTKKRGPLKRGIFFRNSGGCIRKSCRRRKGLKEDKERREEPPVFLNARIKQQKKKMEVGCGERGNRRTACRIVAAQLT